MYIKLYSSFTQSYLERNTGIQYTLYSEKKLGGKTRNDVVETI